VQAYAYRYQATLDFDLMSIMAIILGSVVGIVLICVAMYGFLSGSAASKTVVMLICSSFVSICEGLSLAFMGSPALLWCAYLVIGIVFAYEALSRRFLLRA